MCSIMKFVTPHNVSMVDAVVKDVSESPILRNMIRKFEPGMNADQVYDVIVSLSDIELEELACIIATSMSRVKARVR